MHQDGLQWSKYVFLLENKLYVGLKGRNKACDIIVNKDIFPLLGANAHTGRTV